MNLSEQFNKLHRRGGGAYRSSGLESYSSSVVLVVNIQDDKGGNPKAVNNQQKIFENCPMSAASLILYNIHLNLRLQVNYNRMSEKD